MFSKSIRYVCVPMSGAGLEQGGVAGGKELNLYVLQEAIQMAGIVDDLTVLSEIDEDIILHQLKQRFLQDKIYVRRIQ